VRRFGMANVPDDRDRLILELIQADAWQSYAAIAKRVHLSASAVQRRVERLIGLGVIRGAKAEVVLEEAPPLLSVFVLAELADDSAATIRHFASAMDSSREVIEAYYVTGEADVVLHLEVADMAAYDRFVQLHINRSPLVRRFKTFAVLRSLKP